MFRFKSLLRSLAVWFGVIAILSISQVAVSASEKPESPVTPKNIVYEKYISEGNFFVVLIPKGWGKEEKDFSYAYTKTGDKVFGVELSGPHNKDEARLTISVLYYEYGQFFKSYERYINPQFNKEVQHLGKEGILIECTNKHINISPAKRETI